MKEHILLSKIINTLSNPNYIGDDCAYIKELGIVITQDTLVEDVHFSLKYTDAYKLGYKSIVVNLSDIIASGAKPKYLSISLSLPKNINENFIEQFYKAVNDLSIKFEFYITGGDITGADKIIISVCAIGLTKDCFISSRSNASENDLVIVTGEHGLSSFGLYQLKNGIKKSPFIEEHLMPTIDMEFSKEISKKVQKYAMMDTSDGLADALYKIAKNSNVTLSIDYEKIPHPKEITKDFVLFGGEDYKLVAVLNKKDLEKIPDKLYTIIGKAKKKTFSPLIINIGNEVLKINNLDKTYNHFKE